ncbi:hypothetical protein Mapa_009749 [Marchantia paleacea]|nr:hypothetical protein Mapa_009749 [Marchantia paleacea]
MVLLLLLVAEEPVPGVPLVLDFPRDVSHRRSIRSVAGRCSPGRRRDVGRFFHKAVEILVEVLRQLPEGRVAQGRVGDGGIVHSPRRALEWLAEDEGEESVRRDEDDSLGENCVEDVGQDDEDFVAQSCPGHHIRNEKFAPIARRF